MEKVIIFDLYDTVLKDVSFDFNRGILYLYDTYFAKSCSLKELIDYSDTFLPMYNQRKSDNHEICLCKDEIPLFFEKFKVPKPKTYDDIDYAVMTHMQEVTLTEEVEFTLKELNKRRTKLYILSNSIFSGNSTRKLLRDFGILQYFEKVYSSADYGIRKPSPKFYQIALDEIKSSTTGMNNEDIFYVGNDYVTDVMGSASTGLKTIWYNIKHLANEKNIPIYNIDDFRKILEIVG